MLACILWKKRRHKQLYIQWNDNKHVTLQNISGLSGSRTPPAALLHGSCSQALPSQHRACLCIWGNEPGLPEGLTCMLCSGILSLCYLGQPQTSGLKGWAHTMKSLNIHKLPLCSPGWVTACPTVGLAWYMTEDWNKSLTLDEEPVTGANPIPPSIWKYDMFQELSYSEMKARTKSSGEDCSLWRENRSWMSHSRMAEFLEVLEIGMVGLT